MLELKKSTPWKVHSSSVREADLVKSLKSGRWGKTLVCTFSNPHCYSLRNKVGHGMVVEESQGRQTLAEDFRSSEIIFATNIVRASLTVPDLDTVVDFKLMYEDVDFPRQGFNALILSVVSPAMIVQLRGRVGRVRDGTYVSVEHQREAMSYDPAFAARLPAVSRYSARIDFHQFPHPIFTGSILTDVFSQVLARDRREDGQDAIIERDDPLQATDHSLNFKLCELEGDQSAWLKLVIFFDETLSSRLHALSRDSDQEIADVYDIYSHLNEQTLVDGYQAIIARLEKSRRLTQELFILKGKTGDLLSVPQFQPWSEQDLETLGVCLWNKLAKHDEKGNFSGIFREFCVPAKTDYPVNQVAIMIGLGAQQGSVVYHVAVLVPGKVFSRIESRVQKKRRIYVHESLMQVQRENLLHYRFASGENRRGKGSQVSSTCYETSDSGRLARFEPENLSWILSQIKDHVHEMCELEPVVKEQGCAMSSTFSFPVLNLICYACDLYVERTLPGQQAVHHGFGDDDLTIGTREAIALKEKTRESFLMMTNKSSSGVTSLAKNFRLLVFTERIFSSLSGRLIESLKVRGLANLFHAMCQDDVLCKFEYFEEDYSGISSFIAKSFPVLHTAMTELRIAQEGEQFESWSRRTVRSTQPRLIAFSAMRNTSFSLQSPILTSEALSDITTELEKLVLLVAPSTKGEPLRVMGRKTDRYPITSEIGERVNRLIERNRHLVSLNQTVLSTVETWGDRLSREGITDISSQEQTLISRGFPVRKVDITKYDDVDFFD